MSTKAIRNASSFGVFAMLLLVLSILPLASVSAFQSAPDMSVYDFNQLGKTKGGQPQLHYLAVVAGEYARNYNSATENSINNFFTVPKGRQYADGIYAVAGYIKSYIQPADEPKKSVKGIVDLCIISKFGPPPTAQRARP